MSCRIVSVSLVSRVVCEREPPARRSFSFRAHGPPPTGAVLELTTVTQERGQKSTGEEKPNHLLLLELPLLRSIRRPNLSGSLVALCVLIFLRLSSLRSLPRCPALDRDDDRGPSTAGGPSRKAERVEALRQTTPALDLSQCKGELSCRGWGIRAGHLSPGSRANPRVWLAIFLGWPRVQTWLGRRGMAR